MFPDSLDIETVVKFLILPSSLVTIGGGVSIVLLAVRQLRRWALPVSAGALTLYLLFGAGPVSFLLLGALEYRIPPATVEERGGAKRIVVLTGHAEHDPETPLSSHVNDASASRLLETLNLHRATPALPIIITGGGQVPIIMRDLLVASGVPAELVESESRSFSTYESAVHLAPLLEVKPFLLVTSAGHMPRAVGVFKKAGMQPIPVPTHYMSRRNWLATQYLPSPLHLRYSDLAVSEYAALAWYYLNGRL